MGTEYFLVNPEKKEIFYLAKHFECPESIPDFKYKEKAEYLDCDGFDDFFWDMLKTNWNYFYSCNLTLEQVYYIIYKIYEWCACEKVYLDNDCSTNFPTWENWQETGSICDLLEEARSRIN